MHEYFFGTSPPSPPNKLSNGLSLKLKSLPNSAKTEVFFFFRDVKTEKPTQTFHLVRTKGFLGKQKMALKPVSNSNYNNV